MMNRPETITPGHARQRTEHAAQGRRPRMPAPKQADRRQRQADEQGFRIYASQKDAQRIQQEIGNRQPCAPLTELHLRQVIEQRRRCRRADQ